MEEFIIEEGVVVAVGAFDEVAWLDYRCGEQKRIRRAAIAYPLLTRVHLGDKIKAEVNFMGTRVRNVWKGRLLLGYDNALPFPPARPE